MKLRKLKQEDEKGMLEWMTDPEISQLMNYAKNGVTKEKVEEFIKKAQSTEKNMHLAIVDENDQYMGTVSLKGIDYQNQNAEFAIATRKCARGKGVSDFALEHILEIAFTKLKLHKVYLYVRSDNTRAIKFYERKHLKREGIFREHSVVDEDYVDLIWYGILQSDYENGQ